MYSVGTKLNIKGLDATVIGYIEYANPEDGYKTWVEYRLKTHKGECWLSCDEVYNEYSISWPANYIRGQIGPEWHKVDEGTQIVQKYGGDVDVDPGERASFVEYEDASEDNTLSVEMWSEGTEYSTGSYIEKTDIFVMGYEKPKKSSSNSVMTCIVIVAFLFIGLNMLNGIFSLFSGSSGKSVSKYLKNSSYYEYETSITGQENQKADVYEYYTSSSTDQVAMDIIDGIDGETESVTQKDDLSDEEIAIVTKKEYCLIYHPEDDSNKVLIQVSSRKYNYTSDNSPYRCSHANTIWYRDHYYSSSYSSDSSSYKNTPSAYTMYDGSTIHNIGNGYFDSYSNSIRQASINSRNSSSGGISSGK